MSSIFNAISNGIESGCERCTVGDNILAAGSTLNIHPGTYSGSPYAEWSDQFGNDPRQLYYSILNYYTMNCLSVHDCVLDGQGQARILNVYGTTNQVLMIRGVTFYRGEEGPSEAKRQKFESSTEKKRGRSSQQGRNPQHAGASILLISCCLLKAIDSNTLVHLTGSNMYGGGLNVEGMGIPSKVTLELCKFDQNRGQQCGGAIYFSPSGADMVAGEAVFHLYAVVFTGNRAVDAEGEIWEQEKDGNDMCLDWADSGGGLVLAEIHSTCPTGWSGSPSQGAALDTKASDGDGQDNNGATGTVSSFDTGTCDPCPAGSVSGNWFDPSSCTTCSSGQKSSLTDGLRKVCDDCLPGTSGDSPASDQCVACTGSTYTASAGEASCSSCPGGTLANSANTACTSDTTCPVGQGQTSSGLSCETCPLGKYNGEADSSQCSFCPAGSFTSTSGSTSASSCENCPTGRYSQEYAALSECTACAAGKQNANTASTLSSACVNCVPGTYSDEAASECQFCPSGESVRGAKRRVEEAGVLDIDVHGRYFRA